MTWISSTTITVWPLAATILLLLFLAAYSWRRRSMPGALPFMVGCLFAALIIIGTMMTVLVVDPAAKIFGFRFQTAWMPFAFTAITCFVLEFAWPGRWLTRRNLALLSIFPLISVFYFLSLAVAQMGDTTRTPFDVANKLVIVYILGTTFINLAIFAWLFVRSSQYRWPVFIMICAEIYIVTNIVREASPPISPILNFLWVTWPYMAYAVALFGFRIFDPVSLARNVAMDQLRAGMIVLDLQQRVINLNPSAENILSSTNRKARNRLVREFLPDCSEDLFEKPPGMETECSLGSRIYSMSISKLKDFRGFVVGYLLMLRDITEQKHAQAQILEQQRTLATQNERERLARELHDSLGQVLSYASLQVETSAQLSLNGQGEAAAEQLTRLGNVVREAHADLREHILNLHSTASLEQPFLSTAKQYLDGFTRSYPIKTLLNVDPGLGEGAFPPQTKLQLLRILQEAVSNARKHGKARKVEVSIQSKDSRLCMTIHDDGCGFHPHDVERSGKSHYGLQFMRDRAETLGGSLQVHSAPGSGTRVELVIPGGGGWREGETRRLGDKERM